MRDALIFGTADLDVVFGAGSIPSELGNLVAFKDLCLRSNELSGKCGNGY